jgi:hypothetical protein
VRLIDSIPGSTLIDGAPEQAAMAKATATPHAANPTLYERIPSTSWRRTFASEVPWREGSGGHIDAVDLRRIDARRVMLRPVGGATFVQVGGSATNQRHVDGTVSGGGSVRP